MFGGRVKLAEDGPTIEEIDGKIHFDSSSDALAIAMGGKVFVIGFGQFLLGGILDQNPAEEAFKFGDFTGTLPPFFEQGEGEGVEHEGDGKGVGAFPDCLFGERKWFAVLQPHRKLIEGGIAGENGIDKSKEIPGS